MQVSMQPDHLLADYLGPLVQAAARQVEQGAPANVVVRDAIVMGFLTGRGMSPEHAVSMVQMWRALGRPTAEPPAGLAKQIESFMTDQLTAAVFYDKLAELATDDRVKRYIRHAQEDERKHYQILGTLYQAITGRTFEARPRQVEFQSLADGLRKALDDELEAAEEYRAVYLSASDPDVRDSFFVLMSDEVEHAIRFTYALQTI